MAGMDENPYSAPSEAGYEPPTDRREYPQLVPWFWDRILLIAVAAVLYTVFISCIFMYSWLGN